MKRHRTGLIESGCLIVLGRALPVLQIVFCLVWNGADESGAKMAITCVKIQGCVFGFTASCQRRQQIKTMASSVICFQRRHEEIPGNVVGTEPNR